MKRNSKHLQTGKIGEDIACQFLRRQGFRIIERNVNRKWGELDVVAQHKKSKKIHVVEVKTVGGSEASTEFHPLENLTKSKREKLERTCILYAQEKGIENWQLDALLVWWDEIAQRAEVEYIEHIAQ